jgi:Na+-driven multidrug efflux pump
VGGTFVHGFLIYLLCFVWNFGFNGIMWATAANFFTRFVLEVFLVTTTSLIPKVNNAPFFSRETVSDLKPVIQINLTSGMMGVWSFWCLDVFTLIASTMSTEAFAAQSIIRTLA